MQQQFIGVLPSQEFYARTIKAAFTTKWSCYSPSRHEKPRTYFDLCTLHGVPGFDYGDFPEWIQALHCKEVNPTQKELVTRTLVNYFMCKDATDPFEIDALLMQYFTDGDDDKANGVERVKTIFRIGKYKWCKVVGNV